MVWLFQAQLVNFSVVSRTDHGVTLATQVGVVDKNSIPPFKLFIEIQTLGRAYGRN